ncbi:hypothetical protein BSKO_01401 [Bryopsis sp. KO-2023]|nr:hypothetical protein BSKO_01401 [Bryopsis sp. KO-2023]
MALKNALIVFALGAALSVATAEDACYGDAKYKVFNSCVWSSKTHPTDYPDNAHWSPLCGTSHSDKWTMYKEGEVTTTEGVKLVAEIGSCSELEDAIEACGEDGYCKKPVNWKCSMFSGTCDHEGKIEVDQKHPYVSLISMIAPSPDWMVGVSSLNMCKDGKWMKEYSKMLYALDAGTDSGDTFKSSNAPTEPWEAVSRFDAEDKSNIFWNRDEKVLNPICTITFTLDEE